MRKGAVLGRWGDTRRKGLGRRGGEQQWKVGHGREGKGRKGDPGSSQPHQLQPLFEFNEWILASEAREAETFHPQPSPAQPSLTPVPIPLLPRPLRSKGPIQT